jgi:hypothetical protein
MEFSGAARRWGLARSDAVRGSARGAVKTLSFRCTSGRAGVTAVLRPAPFAPVVKFTPT